MGFLRDADLDLIESWGHRGHARGVNLLTNDGTGTFTASSLASVLQGSLYTTNMVAADLDGDGGVCWRRLAQACAWHFL